MNENLYFLGHSQSEHRSPENKATYFGKDCLVIATHMQNQKYSFHAHPTLITATTHISHYFFFF